MHAFSLARSLAAAALAWAAGAAPLPSLAQPAPAPLPAQAQHAGHAHAAEPPAATAPVLGRLLPDRPWNAATDVSSATAYYEAIPAELEPAVRGLAQERYDDAATALEALLAQSTTATAEAARARARLLMWKGLTWGQRALYYPSSGREYGATAVLALRAALAADPAIFEAPDVARTLGQLAAENWAGEDPQGALYRAIERAEASQRAIDFYYAGVISQRLSRIAWATGDTTEQDKKTFALMARAVALEPTRYESWTGYIPALLPVRMHATCTSESQAMYRFFRDMPCRTMGDAGPGSLRLRGDDGLTMQSQEDWLQEQARRAPSDPWVHFALAISQLETTAPEALKRFYAFGEKLTSGIIVLAPREAGYHPSYLYKLAFLEEFAFGVEPSVQRYGEVKRISPHYCEVDYNIAIGCAKLAEQETTGPRRLMLLRRGIGACLEQEQHDYIGRARRRSEELRRRLTTAEREAKAWLEAQSSPAAHIRRPAPR